MLHDLSGHTCSHQLLTDTVPVHNAGTSVCVTGPKKKEKEQRNGCGFKEKGCWTRKKEFLELSRGHRSIRGDGHGGDCERK